MSRSCWPTPWELPYPQWAGGGTCGDKLAGVLVQAGSCRVLGRRLQPKISVPLLSMGNCSEQWRWLGVAGLHMGGDCGRRHTRLPKS